MLKNSMGKGVDKAENVYDPSRDNKRMDKANGATETILQSGDSNF